MNFSQFVAILRARWKLSAALLALVVLATAAFSLLSPKRYTASASVVVDVKPDPITGIVLGQMLNPSIMATQVDIIQSSRVATRVARNLKLNDNPLVREQWQEATGGAGDINDWLARNFLTQLEVRPSRESNVISIGFQAPDPAFAAALANAFVQAYIDTAVELRVDPAKQYSGFFDQRAKDARDALEAASSRLSAFQRDNGIVGSDERLDVETARLNDLSSQLVMMQAISSESRSREAQAAGGKGDRLSEAMMNPVVTNLKFELNRAEAQLQELNTRLGDKHPQVEQARASVAEMRSRLNTELQRSTSSVGVTASINSSREAQTRSQLEAQRAKVLKLKEQRDAMAVLQRDVENAQRSYDTIVGRLNQTLLESQTQQSNINVLSPATVPLKPSSPKVLLNIALAMFVGTLLAVGLALVRELLDRRVRSTTDLIDTLGVPVLGVVPKPILARGRPSLMAQRVISGRLASNRSAKA
ncbi:chain length determinant protein EpsF [Ideonella sp.]|jgi:chain length determinant protein EpsF|uniref:chain length determinant protein EpsF n=1 Tax=Ideonella sp. TaxID=1929293 RepID=UPI0037C0C946